MVGGSTETPRSSHSPTTSSSSSEDDSDDEEYLEEVPKKRRKVENNEDSEDDRIGEEKKRGKTKRKHECPLCSKEFPAPNKLREHMSVHEVARYSCRFCPDTDFDTIHELRAHQKDLHSLANHKCELCPYTNEKRAFVQRHFKQNHIDGIPCTIHGCSLKIAKNRLKAHIRDVHCPSTSSDSVPTSSRAKLTFEKCPRCDYCPDSENIDARYEELMSHMKTRHNKKSRVACSFGCGINLPLVELLTHLETCPNAPEEGMTSTTPSECTNTATETATTQSKNSEDQEEEDVEDLEDEEYVPKKNNWGHSKGDFQCETCGKILSRRETLRKHVRTNHSGVPPKPIKRKEFKCERLLENGKLCGKTFRTELALSDHHNVHDDVKPYACLSCNQKFHARDRFAVHLSKYHQMSIKDLNANEMIFGSKKGTRRVEKPTTSSGTSEAREEVNTTTEKPASSSTPSVSPETLENPSSEVQTSNGSSESCTPVAETSSKSSDAPETDGTSSEPTTAP